MFNFFRKKSEGRRKFEMERDHKLIESQNILLEAACETAEVANVVTHRLRSRLQESIAQFENTARIMNDALVICDLNGRIQAVNPSAEALFGTTADKVKQRFIGDLLVGDFSTGAELWGKLDTTAGPDEMVGLRCDGTTFPIDLNHTQLDRAEGTIVLLVIRDRTSHVEAKSYRSMFESSFDGILVVQSGNIVAANPAVSHMFGYHTNHLLGSSLDDLLLTGQNADAVAVKVDGSIVEVMFTTTSIWWGGEDATLVTVREVVKIADDQPFMICCFDESFTITFANCIFADHYGSSSATIIGKDIRDFMCGDERHLFNAHIKALSPCEPTRRMQMRTQSGHCAWTDHAHFPSTGIEYQRTGRAIH